MLKFLNDHRADLVFVLLGVAAPYILTTLAIVLKLAIRRALHRHGPEAALLGEWHVFHYSRNNRRTFVRKEVWTITLDIRGRAKIATHDRDMPNLVYIGEIGSVERQHVICRLKGKEHAEEFYVRILYPIPARRDETYGIKVGENFDHELFATIYYFSREECPSPTATRRLNEKLRACMDAANKGIVLQ